MKLEGHPTNQRLVLTPTTYTQLLARLSTRMYDTPGASELFVRIAATWGHRPDRSYITFRPTTKDVVILKSLVVVPSSNQSTTKESRRMAAKSKTKEKDPIDELEAELEGLEEVEDEPEVEDEEEETEDDDVPDSSWTAAKLKAYCKGKGIKGVDKKNKAALLALIAAHVDADDEDDEDETEDPLADLDRSGLKALLKEHGLANAKRSESDDDLRDRIRPELDEDEDEEEPDEEDEEDEEDDEEEEDEDDPLEGLSRTELKAFNKENDCGVKVLKSMDDDDLRAAIAATMETAIKPPAKGKGKTPAKGKQPGQLIRKLPAGKLGAEDIAKMAGSTGLNIRNFLRREDNKTRFPKNEELGRYAFTTKQAEAIVKAYKKGARTGK